jgi:hypothetical protein
MYPDLNDKAQYSDCMMDAYASLDEETVVTLMTFLTRDCELVISPEMILDDYDEAEKQFKRLMKSGKPRTDIISVTLDRLYLHLTSNDYVPAEGHPANFKKLVLNKDIPQDLTYSLCGQLSRGNWKHVRKFIADKELINLFIDMRDHK